MSVADEIDAAEEARAAERARVKLVLASGSPRRLALLEQVGITPDGLRPATIDETPRKGESPRHLTRRLARAKAEASLALARSEPGLEKALVLAADTIVAVGRRVLGKPEMKEEARAHLALLSGRNHRVFTTVILVNEKDQFRERVVETRLRFRRLSREDIETYIQTGEWRGKAGGYAIQGIAGSFVVKIVGSYTNVVGLPMMEVTNLLKGEGFPLYAHWLGQANVDTD
jgi:septum formation protein